ncbi:hypothetical protein DPMN_108581 [Dreissena polymorpha]|uniref:Uncharacterized protein n=1 Tax=Dreissena polymorpha TaxID=45954 RepID=A0A9D4K932_DREPO|nr:hypothetical protein DPMN_108581 [Dreissena polymorpha]
MTTEHPALDKILAHTSCSPDTCEVTSSSWSCCDATGPFRMESWEGACISRMLGSCVS